MSLAVVQNNQVLTGKKNEHKVQMAHTTTLAKCNIQHQSHHQPLKINIIVTIRHTYLRLGHSYNMTRIRPGVEP